MEQMNEAEFRARAGVTNTIVHHLHDQDALYDVMLQQMDEMISLGIIDYLVYMIKQNPSTHGVDVTVSDENVMFDMVEEGKASSYYTHIYKSERAVEGADITETLLIGIKNDGSIMIYMNGKYENPKFITVGLLNSLVHTSTAFNTEGEIDIIDFYKEITK